MKQKDKYLVVCTGSQAEPNAILTRIGDQKLPFKFEHDDHVIFSCKTIPVEPNIENRARLETNLSGKGVRIFKGINDCKVYHFSSITTRKKKNLIHGQ